MDDIELDDQIDDDYLEDTSYQACYIYRSTTGRSSTPGRPTKKQKRNDYSQKDVEWPNLSIPNGAADLVEVRKSLFHELLQEQEQSSDNLRDEERIIELSSFIQSSSISTTETLLPTALLLTGLDKANTENVLRAVSDHLLESGACVFVSLQSRQCPNLQSALKNLIKIAIVEHSGIGVYNEFLVRQKKFHPLNFDLELLELFIQERSITKIVVSLSDVEDVEASVTHDLINALQLWRAQIPSILLLGITSTKELFEHRLSKSCLKHLDARTFDFTPCVDQNSNLLRGVQTSLGDGKHRVLLGPSMIKVLRDLNQGQGDNTQSLKANLQYLYLSHFVADPISALCDTDSSFGDGVSIGAATNIARSTASFKTFCENSLAEKTTVTSSSVRKLLNDDDAALNELRRRMQDGMNAYATVCELIYNFSDLYHELSQHVPKMQRSRLEVELQLYQTMNDLSNCQAFDEVRDGILSIGQHALKGVLDVCGSSTIANLDLYNAVQSLGVENGMVAELRMHTNGTHDQNIAPKAPKSREGKSTKTGKASAKAFKQDDKASSQAVQDVVSDLERKLQQASLDVSSLLLHEAYILSSRAGRLKQIFDAQPRSAIERALLKPGDYLTCDCCSQHQHGTTCDGEDDREETFGKRIVQESSMPPACTLFTLLQEAPTIINVRDLFDAFSSRFNKPISDGNTAEAVNRHSARTMTIFYRGLAELKMLGLIKASASTQVKKRTAGGRASKVAVQDIDFIAKTSWSGS